MKKNHHLYYKKTLSYLVVILLFGNFIGFTTSLSCLSEESQNLEQNSQDEFNFYKGINCTKLGEYDSNYGIPYEMIITEHFSRTLAFVREDYGILVVDISDPEQPFFVNHYFARERFYEIFVSDNYLFLVNTTYNILIYNIQDLSNPLLTFDGFIDRPYDFTNLFVQDDILYTGVGYSGLAIYNITYPWNPQFISGYRHDSYSDYFDDIVFRDNFAFVCRDNVFQIVNLTDIHNPNLAGIFLANRSYTDFRDILISDDKAYICADDGCLYILNISDLTNPTQITYIWDSSHHFKDFYLDGSIGYLLSYYDGLTLINLTNLPHIEYIHKEYNRGYYQSLGFYDGHPILLDSQEGIEIYRVNEEDYSVELLSRFWDGGVGVDIEVSGGHAYVANSNNGLEIYKIHNSLTPEFRSRIYLGSSCRNIFVIKNLAYVMDHDHNYLYTIDVSNKRKPKILSYQDLRIEIDNSTYYPSNFEINGDQAFAYYYGQNGRYLAFLDLSNSSGFQISELIPVSTFVDDVIYQAPYLYLLLASRNFSIYHYNENEWNLLTNIDTGYYVRESFVSENYVYFACSSNLVIFNITNPLAPTETTVFYGFDNTYMGYDEVVVESDYAYLIGEYNRDLHILNVEDKEHPYIEGTFSGNETLIDLFVEDDVVYLTGPQINLEIIQLDRFISLLNYIIYTPIAGIAVLIGVPIIIVASVRAKRKREAISNKPTTQMLPREEIQEPAQDVENETGLSVSTDDYDDPKLLALAKKIIEAAEKDTK